MRGHGGEMVYIARELMGRFGQGMAQEDLFDQVAGVQGELYREAAGRRTIKFDENGRSYFAKIHFGVGWAEIFKNLLQGRLPVLGAGDEWRALKRLGEMGIDTMHPVMYYSSGQNPARIRSCIITRSLDNTLSLEGLCLGANESGKALDLTLKRNLITRVAGIARKMHAGGMNHRDFYLCHFLMELSSGDQSTQGQNNPRLYLIDLHRAQLRNKTPGRWRVKDIGGLFYSAFDAGLTKRDLLRFVRDYLPEGGTLRETLHRDRAFWRRVRRRAARLYLQDHDVLDARIARLLGMNNKA